MFGVNHAAVLRQNLKVKRQVLTNNDSLILGENTLQPWKYVTPEIEVYALGFFGHQIYGYALRVSARGTANDRPPHGFIDKRGGLEVQGKDVRIFKPL
jgi:hypothetical protein